MKNLDKRMDEIERLAAGLVQPSPKYPPDVIKKLAQECKDTTAVRFGHGSPYSKAGAAQQRKMEHELRLEIAKEYIDKKGRQ